MLVRNVCLFFLNAKDHPILLSKHSISTFTYIRNCIYVNLFFYIYLCTLIDLSGSGPGS